MHGTEQTPAHPRPGFEFVAGPQRRQTRLAEHDRIRPLGDEASLPWIGAFTVAALLAGLVCLLAVADVGFIGRFFNVGWVRNVERLLGVYVLVCSGFCGVAALAIELGRHRARSDRDPGTRA